MKKIASSTGLPLFIAGLFLWAFALVLKNILHFSDRVFIIVFVVGLILESIGLILIVKNYYIKKRKH